MHFYTADTHFLHRNILKFCNRPFADINEMNEALIYNWNKVVSEDDDVHVVGDFAFCGTLEDTKTILQRLKGRKHLYVGNHDALALELEQHQPGSWASITDFGREVVHHNQRIVICHYPISHWHWCYKNTWNIYGHVHGEYTAPGKSVDVGVDCWKYTPVSFFKLKEKMDTLENAYAIPKEKQWDKTEQ